MPCDYRNALFVAYTWDGKTIPLHEGGKLWMTWEGFAELWDWKYLCGSAEKEQKELGWTNREYQIRHVCTNLHMRTRKHQQHMEQTPGYNDSYSAYLNTDVERFIFSHADCEICNGDESHHQRCLFHRVSVLLGTFARVSLWGLTVFLCLEPHYFITFSTMWQESKVLKNYWIKSVERFHFMSCEMQTNMKGCLKESLVENRTEQNPMPLLPRSLVWGGTHWKKQNNLQVISMCDQDWLA